MGASVFVLGGHQTDFARNFAREGGDLFTIFSETLHGALAAADIDPQDLDCAHVGNFTSEIFCNQGHLGGFFAAAEPKLAGMPASRHEAACASGSMALLSAMAEIEAGRYGMIGVLGIEMMRNVPGDQAAANIGGPAMWAGRECVGVKYPWPHIFSELTEEYDRRFGIGQEHLAEIARINFSNAKRNANSQTRGWTLTKDSFSPDDTANPVIDGRTRKHDCGQITDGGAMVILANEERAAAYAKRRGGRLEDLPRITGWGNRTTHIAYAPKVEASRNDPYVFPHVRRAITDALGRAGVTSAHDLDGIETHDCFTSTEYMAIDHFGLTAPGESWKAIESGMIAPGGAVEMNASGGLIGTGHPVGATGVRMMLDCAKQTAGRAGDYQINGARKMAMLNIGGSTTTTACFVVETA